MAQIVGADEDVANRAVGLPRLQRSSSAPTIAATRPRMAVSGSVGALGHASGRRVTMHSANASASSSSRRSATVVSAMSASSPQRKSTHHSLTLQRPASEGRAQIVFLDALATAGGVTVGGASEVGRLNIQPPQRHIIALAGSTSSLRTESQGRGSSLGRWMRECSRTWAFGCAVFGAMLGGAIAIVLSSLECGICWAWLHVIE